MNIIEITRCVNACGLSYIRPLNSGLCAGSVTSVMLGGTTRSVAAA
jgi:hypothetical protein